VLSSRRHAGDAPISGRERSDRTRVTKPLLPVLRGLWPGQVLTPEQFGRAMLFVVRHAAPKRVLERADINALVFGSIASP
jgi:hypothetical protein